MIATNYAGAKRVYARRWEGGGAVKMESACVGFGQVLGALLCLTTAVESGIYLDENVAVAMGGSQLDSESLISLAPSTAIDKDPAQPQAIFFGKKLRKTQCNLREWMLINLGWWLS